MKALNLTGKCFGRLTVIKLLAVRDKNGSRLWECTCTCGRTKSILGGSLRSGHTQSCGCLQAEKAKQCNTTHGKSGSNIYAVWCDIHARCYNENNKSYKDYGGRGISVAQEWHKFSTFYSDMGEPSKGYTIERKDNDGDYCKDNCTWIPKELQGSNKRNNVLVTVNNVLMTAAEADRALNLKPRSTDKRLYYIKSKDE